jgi:hypothetical protein
MKRTAAPLTLALILVGCGISFTRVQLLTGDWPSYLDEVNGLLVADATYGTAILRTALRPEPRRVPCLWRGKRASLPSASGRRSRSWTPVETLS